MPSKKEYDFLQNDDYDSRIPLYTEGAFQHGIVFQAKYIGTLDIRRPTTRVDIVAAMRRIRYEFKAKGVKKKKVTINISADGVKCTLRKKRRKNRFNDENELSLMHHPIYRIFYVSHDSQDLKIFSYIARDENSNSFKCNVFKSNKKNQAMRIVRTVGQAFEVCHKLTLQHASDQIDDQQSEKSSDAEASNSSKKEILTEQMSSESGATEVGGAVTPASEAPTQVVDSEIINTSLARPTQLEPFQNDNGKNNKKSSPVTSGETYSSPLSDPLSMGSECSASSLSSRHEMQLLKEQLKHTQAALDQQEVLREHLKKETEARIAAQARTHQLLVHNKELLDYIAILVGQIQELEKKIVPTAASSPQSTTQEMQFAAPILQPPPSGRRMGGGPDQSGGSSNSMSSERVDSASSSAENVRVQEMNRQNLIQHQLLKQLEQMHVTGTPGSPGMVLPRLGNPPGVATMGAITRTSSEKVPPHRRDETIAQIQRSAWGRHTTNN